MLRFVPKITYNSGTVLQLSLPQRWWLPEEGAGMGGEELTASLIPVTYYVGWAMACGVTIRFTDDEYPDVMTAVRWILQNKSEGFNFQFDTNVDDSAYDVYLETPAITDRVRPTRDSLVPWVWELKMVIRSTDGTPIFQNIQALEEVPLDEILLLYVPGTTAFPTPSSSGGRASFAAYRTAVLRYAQAIANQPRSNHYEYDTSDVLKRALLLEPERIQLIAAPQGPAFWTDVGTPVITTGIRDPWGSFAPAETGNDAIRIEDDSNANDEGKERTVPFSGSNGARPVICVVRGAAGAKMRCVVRDNTAAVNRIVVNVTMGAASTDEPTVAIGSGAGKVFKSFRLDDDAGQHWWVIRFVANGIVTANVNRVRVLGGHVNTDMDTFYFAGANAWDAPEPASWHRDSTLRESDVGLNFSVANYDPSEATFYLRFIEWGARFESDARYWYIGNAADTGARLYVRSDVNGFVTIILDNGVDTNEVLLQEPALSVAGWKHGVEIELRVVVRPASATHQLTVGYTLDGGAETVSESATIDNIALPGAWSSSVFRLGGINDQKVGGIAVLAAKGMRGDRTMATMREDTNY